MASELGSNTKNADGDLKKIEPMKRVASPYELNSNDNPGNAITQVRLQGDENCDEWARVIGYQEWWGDRPRWDGKSGGRGKATQRASSGSGRGGGVLANAMHTSGTLNTCKGGLNEIMTGKDDMWIIDTGTSNHMTGPHFDDADQTGERRNGLYYFWKIPIIQVSKVYSGGSFELWHKRLGHPSLKVTKLVSVVDISNGNNLLHKLCNVCHREFPFGPDTLEGDNGENTAMHEELSVDESENDCEPHVDQYLQPAELVHESVENESLEGRGLQMTLQMTQM
nr:Retrovirus-related Pol polyprotein from transposon TNT 1-94 [Ipomoea batatas]